MWERVWDSEGFFMTFIYRLHFYLAFQLWSKGMLTVFSLSLTQSQCISLKEYFNSLPPKKRPLISWGPRKDRNYSASDATSVDRWTIRHLGLRDSQTYQKKKAKASIRTGHAMASGHWSGACPNGHICLMAQGCSGVTPKYLLRAEFSLQSILGPWLWLFKQPEPEDWECSPHLDKQKMGYCIPLPTLILGSSPKIRPTKGTWRRRHLWAPSQNNSVSLGYKRIISKWNPALNKVATLVIYLWFI